MKIKLYSTGCPRCEVLKTHLDNKKIKYELVTDVDTVTEELLTRRGIKTVPALEVDGDFLLFKEALEWIKK